MAHGPPIESRDLYAKEADAVQSQTSNRIIEGDVSMSPGTALETGRAQRWAAALMAPSATNMHHLMKLIFPLPGEPRDDQDVAVPQYYELGDAGGSQCRDQACAERPLGEHLMGDTLGGRM